MQMTVIDLKTQSRASKKDAIIYISRKSTIARQARNKKKNGRSLENFNR